MQWKPSLFTLLLLCLLASLTLHLLLERNEAPSIKDPVAVPMSAKADVLLVPESDYGPVAARLISDAEKSIYLGILRIDDESDSPGSYTNQLLRCLIDAVRRGVEVKVKLDNSAGTKHFASNRKIAALLTREGVQVVISSGERFLHAKFLLVDSKYSLVWAGNWCRESLERAYDLGVLLKSPSVAKYLMTYWKSIIPETEQPKMAQAVNSPLTMSVLGERGGLALQKKNADSWPWVRNVKSTVVEDAKYLPKVMALINNSASSVYLGQYVAHFYREGDQVFQLGAAMRNAVDRGVVVSAIFEAPSVDKTNDFAKYLTAGGVTVFRDTEQRCLHSKFLVIDRQYSVIGSTNWLPPAFDHSHELSIVIDSKAVAEQTIDYWQSIGRQKQ